jgi:hypothetical protein
MADLSELNLLRHAGHVAANVAEEAFTLRGVEQAEKISGLRGASR